MRDHLPAQGRGPWTGMPPPIVANDRLPLPVWAERRMSSMAAPHKGGSVQETGAAATGSPRTIGCCLVGGAAQDDACASAVDVAALHGVEITGILGACPSWTSKWQASILDQVLDCRRTAAMAWPHVTGPVIRAVRHLRALSSTKGVQTSLCIDGMQTSRRWRQLDLIVAPATVSLQGEEAPHAGEIASVLARHTDVGIIRVRRRPLSVDRILLIIARTTRCRRLAERFLNMGLWRGTPVSILSVADYRPGIAETAAAQANLLRRAGHPVTIMSSIDLDFETEQIERSGVLSHQVVIMGSLDDRAGVFDHLRHDIHRVLADSIPITLLP